MYESPAYDEQSPRSGQPSYMRGCVQGIQPVFYINGDVKFAGKKILFNQRRNKDFISCLDEITQRLNPAFGAVRNIYTPQGGHRVRSFDDLDPSGKYVAAGIESFKRFPYTSIDARPRHRKPINYNDVPPVYHYKRQVSGRIKRAQTQSIIIKCWANGEDINEPHRILLTPWMQRDWNHILNACTEVLGSELNGAVHKLYTKDGYPIEKLDELEHGGRYICVPAFRPFKRVDYKDTGMKNLLTSPRLDGRFRSLPPLSRDSKTSTNQSSPVHSQPASENGYPYTKRYRRNQHHPKKEEDAVFPAKPVAHKRSSEKNKRPQEINYDKDEGGVFKSKNRHQETKGAQEVKETQDTKVDLPIDQVEAEEVKEEPENDKKGTNTHNSRVENNRNSKNGAATNGHAPQQRNTVAKTNSKRNTQQPAPKQNKEEDHKQTHQPDKTHERQQPDRTQDHNPRARPERKESVGEAHQSRRDSDHRRREEEQKPREARDRNGPKTEQRKERPQNNKKNGKQPEKTDKNSNVVDKKKDEAAVTIQRHYRGYRSRKQTQSHKEAKKQEAEERDLSPPRWEDRDSVNEKLEQEKAATKIQAGFRGHQTRKQLKSQKEQEQNIPPPREDTPPSDRQQTPPRRETTPPSPVKNTRTREDEAAAKIQAGYRGYQTRKELKANREAPRSNSPLDNNNVSKKQTQEDLENEAATKIQAGYRGYKVRKGMKA